MADPGKTIQSALIITVAFAGLVVAFTAAAAWLEYTEPPAPSDAVVLFVGPDYTERKKEAFQLLEERFAARILIPARNIILSKADPRTQDTEFYLPVQPGWSRYPGYYENTHVELLEAKKMMDSAGHTSALLVSSPFHMRRISLISKTVFPDEKYQLTFRGSRYVRTIGFFSLFQPLKTQQVFKEYLKISGFCLYHLYERAKLSVMET
ncbi:MAG: YdcF family protein [Desulfobacteraceae bacterium]|nr:YdcF family protein [Desulfobacteraceae bacterium]